MTYIIAEPCIGLKDGSCVEVCPVDCIHTDDDADQYFIDPDECIDCGVCAEVCRSRRSSSKMICRSSGPPSSRKTESILIRNSR